MKTPAINQIEDLNRSLSGIDSNSEEREQSQYTGKQESQIDYRNLTDVRTSKEDELDNDQSHSVQITGRKINYARAQSEDHKLPDEILNHENGSNAQVSRRDS